MSTKKKLIEQANKRLLNESLPPPVNFTDTEVFFLLDKIFDRNIPEKAIDAWWEMLEEKGRVRPTGPPDVPDGAFM